MKKAIYLLLLLTLAWRALDAQETPIVTSDDLMKHFHESAAQRIEEELNKEDSMRTQDEYDDAWEEVLRTSDSEGETSTQYRGKEARPQGPRVGCICMDGTESKQRGRGACSGHGGVRYWLHQVGEAVVQHATRRHLEHPDPLSEGEKLGLAAYNENPEKVSANTSDESGRRAGGDLYQLLTALTVCVTLAYFGKLYFQSQA